MRADAPIARLVVRAPNWLGDAVLALPAMAAIRRHFAGRRTSRVAAPRIGRRALSRDHDRRAGSRARIAGRIEGCDRGPREGGRFDAAMLFPNSFRSAWQIYRAGIPERWGYATAGRGLLLTRRSPRPPKFGVAPSLRLLPRARARPGDRVPGRRIAARRAVGSPARAWRTRCSRSIACPTDAPLVVLLPGAANSQAKQWPPDRMADLAARLVTQRGACCVVAGAAHDRPAARAIESWLRAHAPDAASRVVDLVGHTSLGALTGVLARAAVCVSNDSGGMHLASALGPAGRRDLRADRRTRHAAGRRSRSHRRTGVLPALHAARLSDRPPLHEAHHGRSRVRRRVGAAAGPRSRVTVKPAVFLDRDGTLIHDVGYLSRVEDVQWFPWSIDAIRLLNRAGFLVCVTTNQGGIGLGFYGADLVHRVHADMSADGRGGGRPHRRLLFLPASSAGGRRGPARRMRLPQAAARHDSAGGGAVRHRSAAVVRRRRQDGGRRAGRRTWARGACS